uniref:ABC-2 type transporter n=1 Tax=Calliarthron tuberculosum TaxID=48942 RepID=M4ITM2_CALTB|nr:ABC-2 type transporter [Calliarthron tuberculosum]AGA63810.1 ABC-2 type transporter [Calliarthron tuberculosum]
MTQYIQSILQPRNTIDIKYFPAVGLIQEISHLIKRLFIQTLRRPSSLLSGIIQPLLWLILFGGLFQNAPVSLFTLETKYGPFLSCGIIIFTSFTGSLNAGLPLIFDREFGFLNRILVAPMISKDTLLISSSCFMIGMTMIQTLIIMLFSLKIFNYSIQLHQIYIFFIITLLITSSISNISIGLAFILPGHIEFLAFTLIINLPILFSSTALAPLSFMPYWLQLLANLNPLTYAIESIRFISTTNDWFYSSKVIKTLWFNLTLWQIILFLSIISAISFRSIKKIISNKLE